MKKIGFLSFGHYQDVRGSLVPTAREALVQAVELAVAAEELGVDGAYMRVHHFAPQYSAPFPLLSAMACVVHDVGRSTDCVIGGYACLLKCALE